MITKNNYLIAGITALMIWTSADLYGAGWNFERTKRAKLWTRVWNSGGIGLPTMSGNDLF